MPEQVHCEHGLYLCRREVALPTNSIEMSDQHVMRSDHMTIAVEKYQNEIWQHRVRLNNLTTDFVQR